MMKLTEVRKRVQNLIGLRLTDKQWQWFVSQSFLGDVYDGYAHDIDGDEDIFYIAKEIEESLTALGVLDRETPHILDRQGSDIESTSASLTAPAVGEQHRATSFLIARRTAEDAKVREFRADVLQGTLLEYDQVEAWIKQKAAEDGEPRMWATFPEQPVPLSAKVLTEGGSYGRRILDQPLTVSDYTGLNFKFLRYVTYRPPQHARIRVTPAGVLDQLRTLSEYLNRTNLWGLHEATLFVLTGYVPFLPQVSVTTTWHSRYPSVSRMHMSIDMTLTPREVAEHYKYELQQMRGGNKRFRPMSEKHIKLGVFSALRESSETWTTRIHQWNTEHPEWAYSIGDLRNFRKQCIEAENRLLYKGEEIHTRRKTVGSQSRPQSETPERGK
jgi:predicted transcriptional regulator